MVVQIGLERTLDGCVKDSKRSLILAPFLKY